jgi:polyisoprenoid-binding protein YceI
VGVTASRVRFAAILLVTGSVFCGAAQAQETVVTFEPASTKIDFTLGATLHTVHGTFQLKRGQVRFDASTGQASGEIVVDATSGNSGNEDRDKKMHEEILESEKYPEIVFVPSQVQGSIPASGNAKIEVVGVLRLHGQDHPTTLVMSVERAGERDVSATTQFTIPYVKWGLKNPSTFILRASDTVEIDIRATERVVAANAVR